MKKIAIIIALILLVSSVCFNIYLFKTCAAQESSIKSSTSLEDNPLYILSRTKVIERNYKILESFGYTISDFVPYFITSSNLQENIAFYCLTVLNREPKRSEPMIFQSKTEEIYLFCVQTDENIYTIVKLEFNNNQEVYESDRKVIKSKI